MSERTRVLTPADYVLSRDDLRQWHHDFEGIRDGDQRKHGGGFTDSAAFTHCICFGAAYRTVEPLLEEIARLRFALEQAAEFIEGYPPSGGIWTVRSIIQHALDTSTPADHPSKRVPVTESDDE